MKKTIFNKRGKYFRTNWLSELFYSDYNKVVYELKNSFKLHIITSSSLKHKLSFGVAVCSSSNGFWPEMTFRVHVWSLKGISGHLSKSPKIVVTSGYLSSLTKNPSHLKSDLYTKWESVLVHMRGCLLREF